jgi:hypothetical protein
VLEPLEWTALDLDLPGAPAGSAETVEPSVVEEPAADAQPAVAESTLLDFDPSQLAPLTAAGETPDDAAHLAEPVVEPVEEPYATISDEVSALADGFGFESEPDAESGQALAEPLVAEPHVAEGPDAEPPVTEVPTELAPAAVLRWDDLLPSLDGGDEDADDATPVQSAPELADVTDATDESEVAEVVEPAETLAAVAAVDQPDEVPAVRETVAEDASQEPEAPDFDPSQWMPVVEAAREIEIADVTPAAEEVVVAVPDATPDVALLSFEELDLPATEVPAAVEDAIAPIEPAVEAPVEEPDLYDFLVPTEPEPAAAGVDEIERVHESAPVESTDLGWEVSAAAGETIEAPAFTWLEVAAPPTESESELAFDAVLFAQPTPEYDPVVGLDEPPPAPVPPVLTAAAPELDDADGASPAAAGAFVTETMAELLSRQGHLEQALDVYAQLEAQRPDDEALRGRADVLRAQLQTPGSHPGADASGSAATTAGAFFASLAFDDPTPPDGASPAPDAPAGEPPMAEPATTVAAPGFFDAPGDPADEQAAARLARAVGPQEDTDALVTAIYDRPPREVAPPPPAPPVAPPAEAPVGLAEFSFERFFAGLEEGVPDPESPPPLHASDALAAPVDDAWATFASSAPAGGDERLPDHAAAPELTPAPVNEDEDLAQFNAWLKGLIGS